MPTLKEFRRWLLGQAIPGLPEWQGEDLAHRDLEDSEASDTKPRDGKLDVDKMITTRVSGTISRRARWTMDSTGTDALLHFGKFAGRTIRGLIVMPEGRSYLRWMLTQEFPEDLKTLIGTALDNAGAKRS